MERFPRSRPREENSCARDFPRKKSSQSGASRTRKGRGSKNVASTTSWGGCCSLILPWTLWGDPAVGLLRNLLCSGQRWAENCRGQARDAQELLGSLVSQDQPTSYPETHTLREGLIAIFDDSRLV